MTPKVTFFPVGNGDMTLVVTESGRRVLIDINIRTAADDDNDDTVDVLTELRDRLERDDEGRSYVDAFLLSHPDQDHCSGLMRHFHLGPPDDWVKADDKILIREQWSSPMVFRRKSSQHTLCADADAFNKEARRRVRRFEDAGQAVEDGDRILILGEDEDGKTDHLGEITVAVDDVFSQINKQADGDFEARLLGPLPATSFEDDDNGSAKNKSSTILQLSIGCAGQWDACRFLTGGDAEVVIWEAIWARHEDQPDWLEYDLLQAPHHCSWRTLSHDGWSTKGEDAQVSDDARSALAQCRPGATIVSSSKPIKDEDCDPPCVRAKREYVDIVEEDGGEFICVEEHVDQGEDGVLEYEISKGGLRSSTKKVKAASALGAFEYGRKQQPHG